MDMNLNPSADFCFVPSNDCDHATLANLSVGELSKTVRRFKRRNISVRLSKPIKALKGKPFRSNNNTPLGHRLY